ncbi:MAG TPA: histidine kinase dimerization/phospho-acceptor domain-containing protein [Pyrinomonadaceae bacterium]|nr:histidine kinase dimerization/phospho-acceptor domain-containing protein [Pyrinomonadaceae bacterium]
MSEKFSGETEGAEGERLRRAVGDCEARLAEAAELAAHVRHEVNNPLTGLIGQTQLLLREDLSATARRRVQTIEQLAERIRDTVAELRQVQPPEPREDSAPPGGAARDARDEPPRH